MSAPDLTELLDRAVAGIGGSRRPGQVEMAAAVAFGIEHGQHTLVQAGTGTGKSLGYLVPLVRHAVSSGRPVVVATATLALQAQIVGRDLPRLCEAIGSGLDREPTYSLLKGRGNYVCKHKLAGGYPDEVPPGALFDAVPSADLGASERLGAQVSRLREWAEETETGDRDELALGVSDRAWRQVSVSASQCLGSQCPLIDSCFSEYARTRAREVDVIVTNHALLAIDAFSESDLLPDHDVLVVDEAHELSARVTSAITLNLAPATLRGAARAARRVGAVPTDLESAAARFETALETMETGRIRGVLPPAIQDVLVLVAAAARTAIGDLKNAGDRTDPTTAGGKQAARTALLEVGEAAERLAGTSEYEVRWLARAEGENSAGRTALHVAPLSVAAGLRDRVLDERTVVLTSATLAINHRFEIAAGAVGLRPRDRVGFGGAAIGDPTGHAEPNDETGPAWSAIDVGSPFDYPRQGILYIARDLPPPGRDGPAAATLDRLVALLDASDGGALCLFSSRRASDAAADHVRGELDLPVFKQGDDSIPALVRDFAADARACLFGTLSLWQGVDVPGLTNRLVVIDRIPFPRPDDPLLAARQEAVARAGGNGFMAVPAAHAALLLAQGSGRLIRAVEDRGVVAVLDSRLAAARYAGFLVNSMPALWRTTDDSIALGSLARLRATMSASR